MEPRVQGFFDPATWTVSYVVWDPASRDAFIVDPVLDYDPAASRIGTASGARLGDFVESERLHPHWVLETHAHADHLSGSQALRQRFPELRVAIGARITEVQAIFRDLFNLGPGFPVDGRQFDRLLGAGDGIPAGSLTVVALPTPGHTPACVTYCVGDAIFTGDALFLPDMGVGRCDFPAGSADALYDSVQRLYALPDATRVFVGHDYQPGGREVRWESTIGAEKRTNVQIRADTARAAFVAQRTARDQALAAPRLLLPSVQININAGKMPAPEGNGVSYLKIPLRH